MPIMELSLEYTYQNQRCINTWNYVATGVPAGVSFSFGLIAALWFNQEPLDPALGTDFFSRLRQLQNTGVAYQLVTVRDVYSLTDFFANPLTGKNGLSVGDASSPLLAFGFRTNQTTKAVRPGQKRLAGVNDQDTENGGFFAAGTQVRMDNLAIEMSEDQPYDDSGQILTYKPAVCSKQRVVDQEGKITYRYYPTEAEQMQHTAQSIIWSKKAGVRSQVTRQYGRGI